MTCGLSPAALRARRALIESLLERGRARLTAIGGGVRAELVGGAEIASELEALAALEAECCPFLTMTLRSSADRIKLEITGPPSAQPLIAELFGPTTGEPTATEVRPPGKLS
jgi:hypothetical protein